LHSLSFHLSSQSDVPNIVQHLPLLPSLTHLALEFPKEPLYPILARCTSLVRLYLKHATFSAASVHCLAQLPSLQRLELEKCQMGQRTASAWMPLRSLRELHLDCVNEAPFLLSLLRASPGLRLVRWRCPILYGAPSSASFADYSPKPELIRQLLATAPQVHMALLLQRTFFPWGRFTSEPLCDASVNQQQRIWDELHQLPAHLPRMRVEVEPHNEDGAL
jgi:hypothetical protein